ncbi:MAG: type II toxin-antitoxin system HicA family toxin [Acidobacteriia bacterium]|nr:type II toxin-antitoxin system HicA family toxin [Terriglobia bacterium]MYG01590.1 type II toxin-antitoxin system HicA family toxin [Terriglobia bacterium]MYK09036.1 type II toxin-antitoxin system HicA family toxin [Terriglobia bacterium]
MRRRKLERELSAMGWRFKRHGAKHDMWTDGQVTVSIPRHREVEEELAKAILKFAARANADSLGTD